MNNSHSDATGGNSDDDRIQICPDCGERNPYRRLFSTHSPNDDRHAEHRFACRSCGATFDEPDSRPRMKGGNSGVHGLAADLLKTDEDDIVLTDGGSESMHAGYTVEEQEDARELLAAAAENTTKELTGVLVTATGTVQAYAGDRHEAATFVLDSDTGDLQTGVQHVHRLESAEPGQVVGGDAEADGTDPYQVTMAGAGIFVGLFDDSAEASHIVGRQVDTGALGSPITVGTWLTTMDRVDISKRPNCILHSERRLEELAGADDGLRADGGTTEDSGGDWFHDDDRGPLERHVYRVEASGTSVGEVDRIEIEVAPQQKLGSQDHATVRYDIDGDHAVLQRVLDVERLEDQLKAIAIAQAIVTRHDAVATVQSVGQRQAELAEEIHGLTIDRQAEAGSNEHANVVNAQLNMAERNGNLPDTGGEE